MQLKFVITGAHGDIAFSLAKIIKNNFKNSIIIGIDIQKNGSGELIFDKIYKFPKPNNKNYKKKIEKLIKRINLLIPTTDAEIKFFHNYYKFFKKKILINNQNILNIFSSKLRTQNFLIKNFDNFSLKYCISLSDYFKNKKSIELPFFLKKNIGSGNQNYRSVNNQRDLQILDHLNKEEWIIEELLMKKNNEYTCSIIKLKKLKKIIIFKRKLHKLGHTMYAEIFKNRLIEEKLLKIADKINLYGSINIQFILQNRTIKIFDINPRFSSTVRMRDMVGFQDCVWWIKEKLCIDNNIPIKILKNKKIIKYFEEKIIN